MFSGYGRPKWSVVAKEAVSKPTEKQKDTKKEGYCSVTVRELSKGSSGNSVRALQAILIANGYSCGKWGADGSFGGDTLAAVKKYQKAKGLSVDGIVGAKTWNALLN